MCHLRVKAAIFNYIAWLEGLFYVKSAVLCVCGLSYSLSCRRRVLTPTFKGRGIFDEEGETYEFESGLR